VLILNSGSSSSSWAGNDISGQAISASKAASTIAATKKDSDSDLLTDYQEIVGTYGYVSDPASKDSDADSISDYSEVMGSKGYQTNPKKDDTDGDGHSDVWEILVGTDPTDSAEGSSCYDSDGSTNIYVKGLIYLEENLFYEYMHSNIHGEYDECQEYLTTSKHSYTCYDTNNKEVTCGADVVREYYCSGGVKYERLFNCPTGYSCNDGVCV